MGGEDPTIGEASPRALLVVEQRINRAPGPAPGNDLKGPLRSAVHEQVVVREGAVVGHVLPAPCYGARPRRRSPRGGRGSGGKSLGYLSLGRAHHLGHGRISPT